MKINIENSYLVAYNILINNRSMFHPCGIKSTFPKFQTLIFDPCTLLTSEELTVILPSSIRASISVGKFIKNLRTVCMKLTRFIHSKLNKNFLNKRVDLSTKESNTELANPSFSHYRVASQYSLWTKFTQNQNLNESLLLRRVRTWK